MASSISPTTESGSNKSADRRSFGLFPYLNEDLKRSILSFVADAPMELKGDGENSYTKSSLTHQLPQVSRKFRDWAMADSYWKDAVLRQTKREPVLWETALKNIIADNKKDEESKERVEGEKENFANPNESPQHSLVQRALEAHATSEEKCPLSCIDNVNNVNSYESHPYYCDPGSNSPLPKRTYKSLYRRVVSSHLRFKSPVFFMPGQLQLGEPYSLSFHEPRYKYLIQQVMRDYPPEARQGGGIDLNSVGGKLPLFLHANRGPLAPSTPAVVVQVLRCQIHNDDRPAEVVVLPLHHVWLEKLWIVPQTNHCLLYHAQALRMPQKVTHDMNHLARQEALAHVLDQLVTSLDDDNDENHADFDEVVMRATQGAYYEEGEQEAGTDDEGYSSSCYDTSDFASSDFDSSDYYETTDDEGRSQSFISNSFSSDVEGRGHGLLSGGFHSDGEEGRHADSDDNMDDFVDEIRRHESDDQDLI